MSLIFDIETIGENYEELDDDTKENLTRWIKREAGNDESKYNALEKDVKEGLGFSSLTGEIVAIGVYDTDKKKGVVYFQAPDKQMEDFTEENFTFKPKTEPEMLRSFWEGIKNYKELVSFNGRSFDVPFLMIRSAIHNLRPSKNLMTNRYLNNKYINFEHIDLYDQMSFYGAVRRRGSLHLYCRAFGIKSPKTLGITGDDVNKLFNNKEYKKIAEYNSWDLIATAELFEKWREYLEF
jgi:predicted PolB exonuclease-like 3'-5' exonuclease